VQRDAAQLLLAADEPPFRARRPSRLVLRYPSGVTAAAFAPAESFVSRGSGRAAPAAASLKSGSRLKRQSLGGSEANCEQPHRRRNDVQCADV
jgi:hypothetical protein